MRWIVASVLALHGLIHLMGFAKAFGLAEFPQLTLPISRGAGVLWALAGGLVLATAALVTIGWRHAWLIGLVALVLSQAVIIMAWRDAWAGTAANVVLLFVVVVAFFTEGPTSFQARFERDVAAGLTRPIEAPTVVEGDLARLPEPVQQYLRLAGVVGRPRVRNYRIRFRGRIRSAPDARWMPFEAEQQSFADQPTRLFLMRARMLGVPVQAFHRLADGHATMQVRLLGVLPLVDARGDEMDRAETVTLFNDMCVLAPGTLLDSAIAWEPVDARSARARFTNGPHTIAATLRFGDDGLLEDFVSDDRSRTSPDGRSSRVRFSTPLRDYRDFGGMRLPSFGEARWHPPEGAFTYGEFRIVEVTNNVR